MGSRLAGIDLKQLPTSLCSLDPRISKGHLAALDNIEHAKKCYIKAGLDADWKAVVEEIQEQHFRKKGLMAALEKIVSDAPKKVEPTFLERAKQRWPKGGKE